LLSLALAEPTPTDDSTVVQVDDKDATRARLDSHLESHNDDLPNLFAAMAAENSDGGGTILDVTFPF